MSSYRCAGTLLKIKRGCCFVIGFFSLNDGNSFSSREFRDGKTQFHSQKQTKASGGWEGRVEMGETALPQSSSKGMLPLTTTYVIIPPFHRVFSVNYHSGISTGLRGREKNEWASLWVYEQHSASELSGCSEAKCCGVSERSERWASKWT